MGRAYSTYGTIRKGIQSFNARFVGKTTLGRQRRRWEDNITMDLKEVDFEARNWIALTEDRDEWVAYVRVVMK